MAKLNEKDRIDTLEGDEMLAMLTKSGKIVLFDNISTLFEIFLNKIKIGGRNLALGTSKDVQGQSGGNFWVRTYTLSEQPQYGETYTLSFKELQLPNNSGYGCNIYLWNDSWTTSIYIVNHFQGGDGRFTFTVDQILSGNYRLSFYRDDTAGFSIREVKLEKSTIPTDWTPAVEEMINV